MNRLTTMLAVCLATLVPSVQAANPLPAEIKDKLAQAGVPLQAVAVVVRPADGSAPVLEHNPGVPMNPASVMKLVTSYAALERMGPARTWKTGIWINGELRDGKLNGDLVVRGGGDPYLTQERLWLMLRELRNKGVREINGRLLLDLSLYDLPPLDPGVFDGDPLAAYNAVPAALLADFNIQRVRLAVANDTVQIQPEYALPGILFTSRLSLSTKPCTGWRETIEIRHAPEQPREIVFEGSFPRACGEKSIPLNLQDPVSQFATSFRALWGESGGIWNGEVALGSAPLNQPPLLEHESAPLADILRPLNKHSNNVMTRMVYLNLGQDMFGAPATPDKSARALREIFLARGLNLAELQLENGSGLSRNERISATSLATILAMATNSPHFSEFESSLPLPALDGTLKQRFTNGEITPGHGHLKTGSLRDVKALAGYVLDPEGKRWIVVILVNHANAGRAGAAVDALVAWVHQGFTTPGREK